MTKEISPNADAEFFEGLKAIESKYKSILQHPITKYFEYRKHAGIPVCFRADLGLPEEVRMRITNLQAETIGF